MVDNNLFISTTKRMINTFNSTYTINELNTIVNPVASKLILDPPDICFVFEFILKKSTSDTHDIILNRIVFEYLFHQNKEITLGLIKKNQLPHKLINRLYDLCQDNVTSSYFTNYLSDYNRIKQQILVF